MTLATARRCCGRFAATRARSLCCSGCLVLLTLMRYVFNGQPGAFQRIGAPMCGLFPFIVMFLVTSIAMLRERTSGTLERLMTLPIAKVDILVGYGIAFGLLAAVQAVVVCLVGFLAAGAGRASRHLAGGLLAV